MQCQYFQVSSQTLAVLLVLTRSSLCPMNATVPIEASGIIPVSQSDVSGIPPIALSIPDFEGQAILRLFGNSTESEIACYSAVITNGATFSQPAAVGSVLGIFTIIAVVASIATAIYGDHIPTIRTHYAHSLSVLVVFSVFHHIYFSGALSVNWPSVLSAFWSNYAWSAGMIYSEGMQNSINQFLGSNKGNVSFVGAASSGSSANNVGGGYTISQIYKRAYFNLFARDLTSHADVMKSLRSREAESMLVKRDSLVNSTNGYTWYGYPSKPGLPLPGNYSGFAGTLSAEDIPASNAFLTGLLWFLILTAIMIGTTVLLKFLLEGLSKTKLINSDRLAFFRLHWLSFMRSLVLRTMLIGFFMMMFLTLFQFTYKGSAGVTAVAIIIFLVFFAGLSGIAIYACFYRMRFGKYASTPDRIHLENLKTGLIPHYGLTRESERSEKSNPNPSAGSFPWGKVSYISEDPQRMGVHQDEDFNKKFGWLSARFRRTRWWFFAVWILYEFVRACFFGGAAGHPLTQVFGLLVVECIALFFIIAMKPFEGSRLNALMVYLLGFSKVATVALSAAFDPRFNLPRIIAVAIGIVIIVIQGILTIALLICIVLGAVSSYMSLTRNREDFRPRKWMPLRERYFKHINEAAADRPPQPPAIAEEPKEPYFQVASVRRCPKIEDEDEDFVGDINDPTTSRISLAGGVNDRASRANSMRSNGSFHNVPFGARVHRASWSSRDFNSWHEAGNRNSELMSRDGLKSMKSNSSLREYAQISKPPSRSGTFPLQVKKSRLGKEREPIVDERPSQEQRLQEE